MCGVPQGSVLGPVLFVIYINELSSVVRSQLFLYAYDAGDTKVTRQVDTVDDCLVLQADLDHH